MPGSPRKEAASLRRLKHTSSFLPHHPPALELSLTLRVLTHGGSLVQQAEVQQRADRMWSRRGQQKRNDLLSVFINEVIAFPLVAPGEQSAHLSHEFHHRVLPGQRRGGSMVLLSIGTDNLEESGLLLVNEMQPQQEV